MYLVYIGESGHTGTSLKDPNQPHHVYAGLMVHEDLWNGIKTQFAQICRYYFDGDTGEAGIPRELRAAEIMQGKGFFSSWPRARRLGIIHDLLAILIQRETPLIVSYVSKEEFASARQSYSGSQSWWRGPWEPTFSRLLFSLELYMDELNTAQMPPEELIRGAPVKVRERAAIMADEARCGDSQFTQDFLKSEIDLPTGAVLDNIHFVRPQDSHCAQLANICAYTVRRHLHQPSAPNPQYTALEEGHVLEVIYPVHLDGPSAER